MSAFLTPLLQQLIAGLAGAAASYVTHKLGPEAGVTTGHLITSMVTAGAITGAVARVFHYKPVPSTTDNIGNP